MRTTLKFEGVPELILERAVELGIARSKTDALRMGIFALNDQFKLIKGMEQAMVARKLRTEEGQMKVLGKRYLSEKAALSKYR